MTLAEQYQQETGLNATLSHFGLPDDYSTRYVQWLETKLAQKPEVRLYSLEQLEETFNASREYFVDDYSWNFEDWLKELDK